MNRFKATINYINLSGALYLTLSSIFYYPYQKIGFVIFGISYLIEIFSDKKWNNISWNKSTIYFTILGVFFLLAFLYYPFESTQKYFWHLISRRMALFAFAIVGFLGVNDKYKVSYFLNAFIISAVGSILYLLFYRIGIIEFITDPDRLLTFSMYRINFVNSHMDFNLYMNFAIVSSWFLLRNKAKTNSWWVTSFYTFAILLTFITLAISEGRTGFLTGLFNLILISTFELFKFKKVLGYIFIIILPVFLILTLKNHNRMSESSMKNEPRIFLWESAVEVIKDKPILGWGISNAQEQYDITRSQKETPEFKASWKHIKILHAHNQFLQTSMEFGILGLLILLFLYIYPIIISKGNRLFTALLLIPLLFQSFFDVVITGLNYAGIFGIILLILLSMKKDIVIKHINY